MQNKNYTINGYLESKLIGHLTALQAKYSKLLPIRVDFYYKEGAWQLQSSIDADMDMRNLADTALYEGLIVGYAWVMEYTHNDNLHFHGIFYANAQKHRKYYPIYQEIEAMWHEWTEGQGYTHDVNRHRKQYVFQALNTLHYYDEDTKSALHYVFSYFAKEEQKVPFKDNLNAAICISEVLKPSGRGRPRKQR